MSLRPDFALRLPLALALWLAATLAAQAASLQVAPTSVQLTAEETAQGLWLSNSGDTPLQAQVRVFRWRQQDGEDLLEPSDRIAISPPMLQLAPHSRQLVRIIRLDDAPRTTEDTYRVLVDELPSADAAAGTAAGLQFVLRYSVPIFVKPAAAAAPALQARLIRDAGAPALEVVNQGSEHAQLVDLYFVARDGTRAAIADGLAGYVLPGQCKRWPLPAALVRADGAFKATINGEPIAQSLALEAQAP
ncbi:molecular chaperone [Xanthomonas hyacinthi]|uniref:Pili assembly chaperone n=1 Tax=Xanthomonas hyacinthi TaxID=56455 RepID=A0A2S7EV01_9XANT|nr:fimbria/pilus periplasmic chaperone [Xanthomonas hyacinthi]KLD74559.1 pili assembly chaperone [Xanthomonas hyacinthi DSM 19077]PPU96967.1 pili assembly chaperone [Xanthomonas hyacinthi]QGY78035.1 molecular chaperone [Xanthomonas hyacinthi]